MLRVCQAISGRLARSPIAALVPAALTLLPVREAHAKSRGAWGSRGAGKGNAVWWQPLLPALAPYLVPNTPGKGNRKKKMQQKRAQTVTNHAIRIEGQRRSRIFSELKKLAHHEKVREVYRDYAAQLARGATSSGMAGGPAATGGQDPNAAGTSGSGGASNA